MINPIQATLDVVKMLFLNDILRVPNLILLNTVVFHLLFICSSPFVVSFLYFLAILSSVSFSNLTFWARDRHRHVWNYSPNSSMKYLSTFMHFQSQPWYTVFFLDSDSNKNSFTGFVYFFLLTILPYFTFLSYILIHDQAIQIWKHCSVWHNDFYLFSLYFNYI